MRRSKQAVVGDEYVEPLTSAHFIKLLDSLQGKTRSTKKNQAKKKKKEEKETSMTRGARLDFKTATESYIHSLLEDSDSCARLVRKKIELHEVDLYVAHSRTRMSDTLEECLEACKATKVPENFVIPDHTIRKLAKDMQLGRMRTTTKDGIRCCVYLFMKNILDQATTSAKGEKRKRISEPDIKMALQYMNADPQ